MKKLIVILAIVALMFVGCCPITQKVGKRMKKCYYGYEYSVKTYIWDGWIQIECFDNIIWKTSKYHVSLEDLEVEKARQMVLAKKELDKLKEAS